jgi:hypothetical protein
MPNGETTYAECKQRIAELEKENRELVEFLAASSLCEECQKFRERRAIIASPRIQVEERCDQLKKELAEAAREINCAGPVAHRIRVLKQEWSETIRNQETCLKEIQRLWENGRMTCRDKYVRERLEECLRGEYRGQHEDVV